MKNLLLILTLTFIASACSKGSKTTASFAVTIAGISAPTGGMVITGKSNSGEAFSRLMTQDSLGLDLNNGVWNFLVVSWDGANAFTGKIRCSTQRAVTLEGKEVSLQFSLTNSHCGETGVAEVGHWNAAATPDPDFQDVTFNVCRTDWANITTNSVCDFSTTTKDSLIAPIASVKVFVPTSDVTVKGQYIQQTGGRLGDSAACYETNAPTSAPALPVFVSDFYFPITFRGFSKPACTGFALDALAATNTMKFSDSSSITKIYTHFSDERLCAEAQSAGVLALSDIGRGIAGHPYGICTLEQLYDWQRSFGTQASYRTADVYLLNDLNLLAGFRVRNSTVSPNAFSQCIGDGSTFAPIGMTVPLAATCSYAAAGAAYSGKFHGLGRTISQFRFRPLKPFAVDDVGLFREVSGTIAHLNLDGVETSGNNNVGGLVGFLSAGGIIKDVKLKRVQIESEGVAAGSVVGYADSNLERIYVTDSTVRGDDTIGGIVGEGQSLTDVSFQGIVKTSDSAASGIAGGLAGSIVNITRGVSSGLLHSTQMLGGLAGTSSGAIVYSRSTMAIVSQQTSIPVYLGGLVGDASSGNLQYSFFAGSITTSCTGACLIGETKGAGAATSSNTWSPGVVTGLSGTNGATTGAGVTTLIFGKNDTDICPADDCTNAATEWVTTVFDMPRLAFEDTVCDEATNQLSFVIQKSAPYLRGTVANPVIICNYSQLSSLDDVSDHVRLEEDLFVDGSDMFSNNIDLAANFNGNGRFLYGVRQLANAFQLFREIKEGATVRNLFLVDFVGGTLTDDETAALAKDNNGTIENVKTYDMKLQGIDKVAGLVVNNLDGGIITLSQTEGSILAEKNMGGLVYSNDGEISQSRSFASLSLPIGHNTDVTDPIGGIAAVNTKNITRTQFGGRIDVVGDGTIIVTGGVGAIAGTSSAGTIADVLVSNEATLYTTNASTNVIGGLVGINSTTITRGVNLGSVFNDANIASAATTRTLVGSNTGTVTSLFADRAALNFFANSNLGTPTDNTTNCLGSSSLASGANYFIKFNTSDREFYFATATGSSATYYKDATDSCTSGPFKSYTPFAADTFTSATLANVLVPLALTNFDSDSGAGLVKTAYVNYLNNGTASTLVWTWDEGKPQLFDLNNK